MARLTIDTGAAGNPATGDTLRTAMTKVNANFTEIYNELGSDGTFSNISFDGNTISTDDTNGNLIIDPNGTGNLVIDATIINTATNSNIKISPNGTGALDVDTSRIINVTDPTSAQDAATKNYVDTQISSSSHNITFVGDDSTGTAVTQGETFKIAGTQNVSTAVSGDTLTITGPDLSNYLNSTQITVSGNKISTTESNANIELDPNGSGDIIVNSGDVLPATDNAQYLGSASKRWHTLFVGPGSINIAGASITNVGGTLKIPGGVEGTQGLSGLFVDPTSLPYGGENDVLGSLFNYDGTTVFYEQSTWTNIRYYVDNVPGYSGWVVGDALPTDPVTGTFDDTSGTTIVPATFSATTSGNNLVSLKLLTGGSGLGAGATDNILAFRVGDPITTYAVTPYSGVLGTANPQGTIQSDSTFTGSVNVNSNLFLHDSVDAYGTISMNSNKITDLGTPTATTDAATKGYVDTQLSGSSHNITFVGDDSTGTAVTQGETFKFAGTQNITTAVSGDTLTITGPDLSSYATQSYVTSQGYITNSTTTIVGDDSTGTTLNSGETIKIAGTQNITTAVSGDTLTVTGPDLTNYLQNTGTQTIDNLSFNDNIISTSSNADLILDPGGTGDVVAGAIRIHGTSLSADDSSLININEGLRLGSNLSFNEVGGYSNSLSLDDSGGTPALSNWNFTSSGGYGFFRFFGDIKRESGVNLRTTGGNALIDTATGRELIIHSGNASDFNYSDLTIKGADINIETHGTYPGRGTFTVDGIQIKSHTISTNESNADLELSANGTGFVKLNAPLALGVSDNDGSSVTVDLSNPVAILDGAAADGSDKTYTIPDGTQVGQILYLVKGQHDGGSGTVAHKDSINVTFGKTIGASGETTVQTNLTRVIFNQYEHLITCIWRGDAWIISSQVT